MSNASLASAMSAKPASTRVADFCRILENLAE
jgi:hypothetical protein